jgi:hypothetical protein
LKNLKIEYDLKKNEDNIKKNHLFLIPLNPSWGWLSSSRLNRVKIRKYVAVPAKYLSVIYGKY